jgi:excinuclease ABC subunit A
VQRCLRRKEEPSYMGTFTSARRYVLTTFATTESASIKKRVLQYLVADACAVCQGKRLSPAALAVTFAGQDIAALSALPMVKLALALRPCATRTCADTQTLARRHPEKAVVAQRIAADLVARIGVLLDLGLGYLALDRTTPTLSPGELQRLRLATQVRSNLFGVVYVLDEPSAGLHPADTEALLVALERLKTSGNSLFVVEHELDVVRRADWLVDVGPGAGEHGGEVLYSGPPEGLAQVARSQTRRHLFEQARPATRIPRTPRGHLALRGITRNNLTGLDVDVPLGCLTAVTGISGSGKSSLVSQALVELVAQHLGHPLDADEEPVDGEAAPPTTAGRIASGMEQIKRLVRVDQRPIGRTPRSNLATYTGLFDHVRRLFASTPSARALRHDAGRFSFNVAKGRCENCEGEGWVFVELLFLPSVYAPCPVCKGARYNASTLEIAYRGKNIAQVLGLTVDAAFAFFADVPPLARALHVLREVGLGYLRLGQPATELSGGEAQRIKLATELQRVSRGQTLFVLDEPTTGLHPSDVEKLIAQLDALVDAGNTVVVVEHDMRVVAGCDQVIDVGPGAGDEGGQVVAQGPPRALARVARSRTAPFLTRFLAAESLAHPRRQ